MSDVAWFRLTERGRWHKRVRIEIDSGYQGPPEFAGVAVAACGRAARWVEGLRDDEPVNQCQVCKAKEWRNEW